MSAEGRLIAGRYRLHQRIGSGAMGVVWRALDERLQRTVAVKQLLLQPGYTQEETEEARQRSMREGRIAARLQHQNAIAIFDVAEDDAQPVLVMEYLPSQSLATVLVEQGLLPPLTVARIGAQVAGALAAAHAAGIVHRDLKPGNILLGDNGESKITDFGISRAIGDVSVTKSGILAGTPAYLSPEVALGSDPNPPSDVFSLGATLYAAIEGEPPFGTDENAISLLHRVARGQVEPPRQAGPMTAALMRLLRPDPAERPAMAQARSLLQSVADGRPVPGGAPAPPRPRQQPTAVRPESETRVGAPSPAARPAPTTSAVPEKRSSYRGKVFWGLAVILAIVIGILAANMYRSEARDDDSSRKPLPSSQTPTSAPPATPVSHESKTPTTTSSPTQSPPKPASDLGKRQALAREMEATVARYYTLVPHKLDAAWSMLGPGLRAQGEEKYERWWKSIDDVRIVGEPRTHGDKVVVVLRYFYDNKVATQTHVLSMVTHNGRILINSDRS